MPVVIGALLIGLSMGLLGAGGSILMVPILRYLCGQEVDTAFTGALFVVGGISFFACLPYARKGTVEWRSVGWFGVPSMVGTYEAGKYLAPLLGQWFPGRDGPIKLCLFAAMMLTAAWFMANPAELEAEEDRVQRTAWRMVFDGLIVGLVTGMVGVGGGFIIVPALVVLGGLDMKRAVGTSLAIISTKSFTGFVGWYLSAGEHVELDFGLLGAFIGVGALASFWGRSLGKKVSHRTLTRGFAVFLLLMGVLIFLRESGLLSL
ncbi:sulfite exporter TauE/SafE family protein [Engelhardtia mirabilis]|uniref:Probable membrane transporter protein n=1 Tax=Engelhardtia mirabilis TaxID=2528011 RepID=A0A518BRW8_9BACT|nr:Sulfite exporter TauE/SafE [Planctomycetes bacterium Pla133]QDV04043.1 Sulfite exporter TauE/SafE [Planctomycetes bacterium Pla86]